MATPGPYKTTWVGRECLHRCNPANVQSHTNFIPNSPERRKLATTGSGQEERSAALVAGWCEWERKVILRAQASSRQICTPRFEPHKSDMSVWGRYGNAQVFLWRLGRYKDKRETSGVSLRSPMLPLRLSRVLEPKLQSRSKRLSLLTNLARGGSLEVSEGARSEEKHIQMFN